MTLTDFLAQEYYVVEAGCRESVAAIKFLRGAPALVNQNTDSAATREKSACQLRQAAFAVAFTALPGVHPHAFDVDDLRRIADDIGLEDQSPGFDPDIRESRRSPASVDDRGRFFW